VKYLLILPILFLGSCEALLPDPAERQTIHDVISNSDMTPTQKQAAHAAIEAAGVSWKWVDLLELILLGGAGYLGIRGKRMATKATALLAERGPAKPMDPADVEVLKTLITKAKVGGP
jgi:hypothetical protein